MKHLGPLTLLATAIAITVVPGAAQAQAAFTAKSVHLRAGPARDYPVVAVLPAAYPIAVEGCLSDYSWCDVIAGATRGWVYAGNINYAYQNSYVPVLNYGAIIGLTVFGFILDDYWGSYYRDRPWYPQRDHWAHRPVTPHPGFRPPMRPGQAGPGVPHDPRPPVVAPGLRHPQHPGGGVPGGVRPQQPQHGAVPGAQHAPPARSGANSGGRGQPGEGRDRQGPPSR